MPSPYPHAYTHNHKVLDDGSVAFECSNNISIWPWLNLPPLHPIVVQTINFWASVESGIALGTFDPEKWSALTHVDWTCDDPDVGHAVRGTYRTDRDGDEMQYVLAFFDAEDRQSVELRGKGVVFRTRNFEGWRDAAKKQAKPDHDVSTFPFADADQVGVEDPAQCFLSEALNGPPVRCMGKITSERGLMPGHPYIAGSGDHVNSTHMGEIGRQFCQLLTGRPLINTGGQMVFEHYVELGRHFLIDQVKGPSSEPSIHAVVRQNGRICTRMRMDYRFAD